MTPAGHAEAPPRIQDYALLGDRHGAALLSRDGSVDWWCPASFDAPAVFARLLGADAGHWALRPRDVTESSRRYLDDTLLVTTTYRTAGGRLEVTDGLLVGPGERGHRVGMASPHTLVRHVRCLAGAVELELELVPRPEYGLVTPATTGTPTHVEMTGGPDRLVLDSTHPLQPGAGRVTGHLALTAGETAAFTLRHQDAHSAAPTTASGGDEDPWARLEDTAEAWRSWASEHQGYRGAYTDLVRRSALVLQALTFAPSGAVVAAATTSLPEELGGTANWDYRYGWLRDGSFTLGALWVAACPDEAAGFFRWIVSSVGLPAPGSHLPIMFSATGRRDLTEHSLEHLDGYRGSLPVRVGNDAWDQKQLDVLGEVMDCAWQLRDQLLPFDPSTAALLCTVADMAADTWQETDAGIWEGREGRRHYVTSKLMCWVALDRAVQLAPQLGPGADADRWRAAAEEVRTTILERGWNAEVGAFTGAFDSDHLDAGVLLMPVVGFLPPDDERVVATLDAVEEHLSDGGLVQRWTGADAEGRFVICSYWLATARAMSGDVTRARAVFDAVTGYANDLGLLAEEVDHHDGSQLGNFPQALSHIGLVNAAWAIEQAESQSQAQSH